MKAAQYETQAVRAAQVVRQHAKPAWCVHETLCLTVERRAKSLALVGRNVAALLQDQVLLAQTADAPPTHLH